MRKLQAMPPWAERLLHEMAALREEVRGLRRTRREYLDFVRRFREAMRPDPQRNLYPEAVVRGRRLGVTLAGLLYDKETGETVGRAEAFELYALLYEEYKRRRKE